MIVQCHAVKINAMAMEDGSASGGYDCEFVDSPPENIETECPVCHGIFREPQQLTCCGKVYCETCIKKALAINNSCPSCRAQGPDLWPDKRLEQSLSGCRVYCCYTGNMLVEDCEWMGELGELDKHLNLKPSPGNQLDGCEYAKIECKFCSECFQRKEIDNHQLTKCAKRIVKCSYCGYINTYEVVTKTHFLLCPKYPIPCPHCKNKYERQNLENHVIKDCPLTPVACDFHVVGCTEKPAREDMASHLHKNLVSHASMLQNHLSQHPNDASKCLPLVARCLGKLVTENQDSHREQQRLSDSLCGTQQEFHDKIRNVRREFQENLQGAEQKFQWKVDNKIQNARQEFQENLQDVERKFQENLQEAEQKFQQKVDKLHKAIKEHTKQIESGQESHQQLFALVMVVAVVVVLSIAVGLVVSGGFVKV